jgi:hypothetical protein
VSPGSALKKQPGVSLLPLEPIQVPVLIMRGWHGLSFPELALIDRTSAAFGDLTDPTVERETAT